MRIFEMQEMVENPIRTWLDDLVEDRLLADRELEDLIAVEFDMEAGQYPKVDVAETDGSYLLRAELPGFDKKNLEVLYNDGILTIRGSRDRENHDTRFLHSERFYGTFERNFALPEDTEPAKLKARYRDGILTVEIPKRKRKVREIKVK